MSSEERLGFVNGKGSYGTLKSYKKGSDIRSIHYRSQRMGMSRRESTRGNLFTTTRSILEESADIRKTPTLLKDNVRLFTTDQLDSEGMLYMREDTFYNSKAEPQYALSISPQIYSAMIEEIQASNTTPLGLYFCCHGGDGAHTGVAHEDYVDIGVAYIIVSIFFIAMAIVCYVIPHEKVIS